MRSSSNAEGTGNAGEGEGGPRSITSTNLCQDINTLHASDTNVCRVAQTFNFSGKTTDTASQYCTNQWERADFASTDGTTTTNLREEISLAEDHLRPVLARKSADLPQKPSHST